MVDSRISKGIILAGGNGSRLSPLTLGVSKHLLPIYDKPMIYYPLSLLMLLGIYDILIITHEEDLPAFKRTLGDGSHWNIRINYRIQASPKGIAEAFIIGEDFIADQSVALILGDNIFYGAGLVQRFYEGVYIKEGGHIFTKYVKDPSRFGVMEIDNNGKILSLDEKPENPTSPYAITGMYLYGSDVCNYAKRLKPSARDELEITDLNRLYLEDGKLSFSVLGRGTTWIDTGTFESLLDAGNFVANMEKHQGLKIYCPDEIAYRRGLIDDEALKAIALRYGNTNHGRYLRSILNAENELENTHYQSEAATFLHEAANSVMPL